jgi:8-oxo-dGTP pyrophosphatase MutT (NUDIX family)
MIRHFTASAFVIDSKKRILLLWHKKAQRWMPPGGHIDATKRECKEEAGLDVEILGETQGDFFKENPLEGKMLKKPFALLLEEIEARPIHDEPAHQHIDFVYLAKPLDENQVLILQEQEGEELRWFTAKEVQLLPEVSIYANVRSFILQAL